VIKNTPGTQFLQPLIVLVLLIGLVAPEPGSASGVTIPSARIADPPRGDIDCAAQASVARAWNLQTLDAIVRERARPTIHARNLFHVSAAMYDAWATYVPHAQGHYHNESAIAPGTPTTAQAEAVSYAAYRVLRHRFMNSIGAAITLPSLDTCMQDLGLDPTIQTTLGGSPAAVGNRVAASVIAHGLADGANEQNSYVDYTSYFAVNTPMLVQLPGTGGMADVNAWQPLIPPGAFGVMNFLTPHWGLVDSFALDRPAPGALYLDPGPPPLLGDLGDAELKADVLELIRYSAWLDPDDGVMIDISPGVMGNNSLGANDGQGHPMNPATGEPYPPNLVRRGDFGRVLAEFWADGPASTTPPGHWNEIANDVVDHPDFQRRLGGSGALLPALEWDVKLYLALNGALHDSAVATWEAKRHYDSARPISLIREMAGYGQSSDPDLPAWHPLGLPLEEGLVELITAQSSAPGERHEHLAPHIGEIAIRAWLGHPPDPATQHGGSGWIRAVEWLPYQQADFVTPPFPGYTSGHSAFSRAAAEVLTAFSGSPYFPGGMGSYLVTANGPGYTLIFEYGPSEPVALQWASYYDAADQSGESRIWGGIHPLFDDFPGRLIGAETAVSAVARALELFGTPPSAPAPAIPVPVTTPWGKILLTLFLFGLALGRLRA